MQEGVENRTLTLIINGTKFSGRMLKAAIGKYLAHRRGKKQRTDRDVTPHGKQSVKKLTRQGQGIESLELSDPSIRQFERIARKYGVDYAVKRDRASNPPRFLVFFKGRDNGAITAAFQEYAGRKMRKASRPSVLQRLAQLKQLVKAPVADRERQRERER